MKTIATFLILFASLLMNAQPLPKSTVDVSGEGTISVVPDQVAITVRVEHEGKIPKEVKQMNDRTINDVFQYLKNAGVDDKSVKTEYLNLNKNYDYNTKTYSYVANQTLRIQLKDLTKYETVMNGLLETGINRIDGIAFSSSKSSELEREARKKAVLDAKMKAEEFATTLGQSIGKAVHISEFQNVSYPTPYLKSAMAMDAGSVNQTLSPGEMEISIRVNVSFELN